jgi:hypothetical protein
MRKGAGVELERKQSLDLHKNARGVDANGILMNKGLKNAKAEDAGAKTNCCTP